MHTGTLLRHDVALETDAIAVGKCDPNQRLSECLTEDGSRCSMAALSSLHMLALVRYTLLLVQLLTFTAFVPNNEHDIQQNTALAIVRTSAQRETPLALKLSATPVVGSERTLPLLLGPTHRPSIFAVLCLPNHHPNTLFMSIFVLQV